MKRALVLIWVAALLALGACHKDVGMEEPPETQTVIVFMPWSTNLTSYFKQNIEDFETAISGNLLSHERVIVGIASSQRLFNIIELRQRPGACVRDTLSSQALPDFTQRDNIKRMLLEISEFAPADKYALIVGGHGTAWLPVSRSRALRQLFRTEPEHMLTRYFGGLSDAYKIETTTLSDAILAAGMRMEYVLFDDCYMSSVEVAYDLKDATDWLIACPTEILMYGFPYDRCAPFLVGKPDYAALCTEFIDYYGKSSSPYGTIGVTDCREMDAIAGVVREINLARESESADLTGVQVMDGYDPTLFYDFGDYITRICPDPALLDAFNRQLSVTVPYKGHTPSYYTDVSRFGKVVPINTFSGITVSAPTPETRSFGLERTRWYQATH